MATTERPTREQRSSEVRAKWGAHTAAWKATGGRQFDYCQAQGLGPSYFSIWKGRLERVGLPRRRLAIGRLTTVVLFREQAVARVIVESLFAPDVLAQHVQRLVA